MVHHNISLSICYAVHSLFIISSDIPVLIPLQDTDRSCSAYRKHHPTLTDKLQNDKINPMPHPVKFSAVW